MSLRFASSHRPAAADRARTHTYITRLRESRDKESTERNATALSDTSHDFDHCARLRRRQWRRRVRRDTYQPRRESLDVSIIFKLPDSCGQYKYKKKSDENVDFSPDKKHTFNLFNFNFKVIICIRTYDSYTKCVFFIYYDFHK